MAGCFLAGMRGRQVGMMWGSLQDALLRGALPTSHSPDQRQK